MRVFAHGNCFIQFEGAGLQHPDFVIGFVANVKSARAWMNGDTGQEYRKRMWRRMIGALKRGLSVRVFKDVDRPTIAAADEKVLPILGEGNPIKYFRKRDELSLTSRVQSHNIEAFLVVPCAHGDHCLPI